MGDPVARLQSALGDRYVFERELGHGGMATVYLTSDLKHHRKVAVKVLRPELVAAVSRERFQREISIVAHLTHPHILPLYDSGVVEDTCFFVMPFVKGETLRTRLDREGQLPIEEALRFACEIADALAYAHSQNVVHRDIKPQNIMLESGHAVVADFGIAMVTDDIPADRLTHTGFSLGTPHYMSPEQGSAARRIDGRTDIYSLGCVLYEMLAGTPPFSGANVYAIMARHAAEPPPSIRVVRRTVSEFLEDVTFRALAKSPADRYRTAEEFVQALTEVTHELVRETGPGRTAVPRPLVSSNGEHVMDGAAGHGSTLGEKAAAGLFPSMSAKVVQGTVIAIAILSALGFLSTVAFDTKLQIPSQYTPTQSNFPLVGARALLPSIVYGFLIVLFVLVSRYLLRMMLHGVRSLPGVGDTVGSAQRFMSDRWRKLWDSWRPEAIGDGFFIAAVLISTFVLFGAWPLLVPIFTSDVELLGCANRPMQRFFQPVMTLLIVVIGTSWVHVFRRLKLRSGNLNRLTLARWGSVVLILLLLVIMTLPWRLMWAGGYERVRIGNDRGYLIRETDTEVVLYNADRRVTTAFPKGSVSDYTRMGIHGYVFEEPEVFESGLRECESVTDERERGGST